MTFYLRSFEKAQCKQLKIIAGKYGWLTESFLQTSDWSISFSSPGWRLQKTSCAWHLIHHRTGQKYEMTGPSDVDRGWSWKDDHNMVQHSGPVSHRMQNSTPLCIKHALGMWERHFPNKEWETSDAGEAILCLEISACCERISRLLLNWFPDEFKYQASREISMGQICWLVGPKAIAVFKWNAIQRRKRRASLYIHQHVNVRRKAWKSAWVNGAGV